VQYSYDDQSIVVVNSQYRAFPSLKVTAKVYNLDMKEKFSKEVDLGVGPDSSTRVFTLPELQGLSSTYFVSLELRATGQVESRNFYWLSTHPETLDWSRQEEDTSGEYDISTWTPNKDFADYTALNALPRVDLDASARYTQNGHEGSTTVSVRNPSSSVAFAIHLKVNRTSDERVSREAPVDNEILPVLWQDNYFALLPGETREVTATYAIDEKNTRIPKVEIEGWNVNPRTITSE